ncbi:MAG: alpha/beta hydrolase [Chloroflexota bacterium]
MRGLRIHARVAELPDAAAQPTVILVHGLLVSSRYMLPTARGLAPRWRVHVPDLPGYGKSAKLRRALDAVQLAEALAEYVKSADLTSVTVVANSFGCQVAAEFAARYPERIEGLVLLGPTVDPRTRPAVKLALRWLADVPLEPAALDVVILRDLLDMGLPRTYETFRHMMNHHIERVLPHIQAPTLVIRGGRDSTVSQQWAEDVVGLLPRGQLAVIPGAPHTINFDSAAEVVRLVEAFLHEMHEPV